MGWGGTDVWERWWLRHQSFAAWVLAAFVFGSLVGALGLSAISAHDRAVLAADVVGFVNRAIHGSPAWSSVFGTALLQNLKVLGLIYALGVSVAGLPLILLSMFFRGFVLGFALGFFVDTLHGTGLAVAVIAVIVPNLLLVPAWITASAGGLAFAWGLLHGTGPGRRTALGRAFAEYTVVALAAAALVIMGTALQAVVAPLILRWMGPWGV